MEKLKLSCRISPDEWLEGYDLYYKKFRQKFTYIRAALFIIPMLLFLQQVWLQPSFIMGWVCIAVCVAAVVCIFLNPKNERNAAAHALEGLVDKSFEVALSDDRITVSEVVPEGGEQKPPAAVVVFSAEETERVFAVMSKSGFIAVPKGGLSKYDLEALRDGVKKG